MDDLGFKSLVRNAYPESDLSGLFSAGEAIEQLRGHPGWVIVQALLAREVRQVDATLDGSKPLQHAEYTHLHGQRRGLRAAALVADALEERYRAVYEEQQRKHEGTGESVPERTGA